MDFLEVEHPGPHLDLLGLSLKFAADRASRRQILDQD
jgi:hypothetical protein